MGMLKILVRIFGISIGSLITVMTFSFLIIAAMVRRRIRRPSERQRSRQLGDVVQKRDGPGDGGTPLKKAMACVTY